MQRSIEVEYWVIDRNGALTTPGALTEVSEYVEAEFVEPLFELKTPPCETHADLRSVFLDQLDEVLTRADELDKMLVPLGTPINSGPIEQLPSERSRIQEHVLGRNFDYAKYCAGTHLHFEKRNVTDQLNVLAGLDPALALLNSSPYFQGKRIASGARAYLYRKKCYEHFPKYGQLWDYVHTVAEWERRLDRRFEQFKELAVEAGVDEDSVDAHFSPDDVVWTPVRLRDAMPTIEWRSPDAALPSQILRLADEIDSVMEQLHHTNVRVEGNAGEATSDAIVLPEFDAVRDYAEQAIHDGLESADVAAYLDRMGIDVDRFDPATVEFDGYGYIDRGEARELRRQYGNALRRDVTELIRD